MNARKHLQQRRALETIGIEHEGQRFKVGIGRDWCDQQLGPIVEVWLNAAKVNSTADVMASDGAILMSLLIQYGCPPSEIVKSMKHNSNGTPASPLGVAAALVFEATQQQGG